MNQNKLIGREKEIKILKEAFNSTEAEMVAVIGRRRVGKTFLINSVYKNQINFEITGIQGGTFRKQLKNFQFELKKVSGKNSEVPKDWFSAFVQLIDFLEKTQQQEKQVVFFDELPWLATKRSDFLQGLSFFWNSYAVKKNIVVAICGSAASWMIQKVVNHKGGLHNRITKRINLKPFTLSETEAYFKCRNLNFNRYQIAQIYMAFGGVPHYLKEIQKGKTAAQNINTICFESSGFLNDEFSRLFSSLFNNPEKHIAIIRKLAKIRKGLTRLEIIKATGIANGGGIKRVLDELEFSGFIARYAPFGKKKKEILFRLTDEYSLFYLTFIEKRISNETEVWEKLSQTQTYKTWSGYAFESICLKHISKIKQALQIGGIHSESSSFYRKGKDDIPGVQIDLLIDRNDQAINLFEIKFYKEEFILSKEEASKLRKKVALFRAYSKTRKQLFLSLIATFGIIQNQHSLGLIDSVLTLDDLF